MYANQGLRRVTAVEPLKQGDRVGYTKAWLRNVTLSPTDPLLWRTGTVVTVGRFVYVRWEGDSRSTPVAADNLCLVFSLDFTDARVDPELKLVYR